MPTTIKDLEEALNSVTPEHSSVHVINRGVPFSVDPILRGTARFARKTGAFMAVLNADNVFILTKEVDPQTKILKVDRILAWLEQDSLVSFGPLRELSEVADFDILENTITLKNDVILEHKEKENVLLYAVPIKVFSDAAKGNLTLNVASQVQLFQGDALEIQTGPSLLSLVPAKVTSVVSLGTVTRADNRNQTFQLSLSLPLPASLKAETTVYLRAVPAYQSLKIKLPTQRFSAENIGSFLMDYISGRLKDVDDANEQFNATVFDAVDNVIVGPLPVNKNFVIVSDINLDALLFWDLAFGKINLRDRTIEGTLNEEGKFLLSQETIPALTGSFSWLVKFKTDTAMTVRIALAPNDFVEVPLPPLTLTSLTVSQTLADEPVKRIELVVTGPPNKSFQITSWALREPRPSSISYSLLSDVTSLVDWQATGLLVKPYFLTLDYLKARTEIEDNDLSILHV